MNLTTNTTQPITRRRLLKLMLGGVATIGIPTLGGVGYVTLIEPNWPVLERVSVPLATLPADLDGFTIAQLSDLHRGPAVTSEDIARAMELALHQEPDMAVLTGDFVTGSAEYAVSCAKALASPGAVGDIVACLGNHDHWTNDTIVAGALTDAGVTVLRNSALYIAEGLWIAAVNDVWVRKADLEETLENVPDDATVMLLAHEPDFADVTAANGRVSLQLSGHSHGGQVRPPFVEAPLLPYLGRKYSAGLYRVGSLWLYVNRGVGLISPAVRFNCRPEVTLLTLRRAGLDQG
jgi:predicted MPP superfamily phosphohydrolase